MESIKNQLISLILTGLLSIIAFVLLQASDELREVAKSVQALNTTIKVVIIEGDQRQLQINDHELRLREVEKNRTK